MREEPHRWISEWRTGRLWHVRPDGYFLKTVAERAGVPHKQKPGYFTGHGAYRHWIEGAYSFEAADARRAAPGILSGMVELDPAWRTDTRKGRLLYLGFLVHYFFIRLFAIALIIAPIAFVVFLVVATARGD